MTYRFPSVVAGFLAAAALTSATAHAQRAPESQPPERPPIITPAPEPAMPDNIELQDFEPRLRQRSVVRFGQDYTLPEGDTARDTVIISGNATINGTVDGDVVVIVGHADLGSKAVVTGDLVVIGGTATIAPGAVVERDFVAITTSVDAPAFRAGGDQVVIDPLGLGGRLEGLVPWITRGLLWGRVIVADQGWIWWVVGVTFFAYLIFLLLFPEAVRSCANTLAARPLSAFLVGLLVLLLSGPVALILVASLVGVLVVPFLLVAMLVAGLLGRIAFARWIGARLITETEPTSRVQLARSFAIGSVVVVLAYMVPVLGLMTWGLVGVLGLGAATMTFVSGWRRENPAPPKPLPRPPAPPPVISGPPPDVAHATPAAPFGAEMSEPRLAAEPPVAGAFVPSASALPVGGDLSTFPRAMFIDRFAAFALDLILVSIVLEFIDYDRFWFLAMLAYHITFWTLKGTTVGGIICNLRVTRIDGAPLRFVDALIRGLASIFSLAVLGIGCLWILKDPERQAWHDIIAGTYVVKVPRNFPL